MWVLVGVGLASGSRIGIQGTNAVGRQIADVYGKVSVVTRAEVALGTIDGISIAAGGLAREAVKEAFVISLRRETAQQIVRQGIKEAAINNIIKSTTKNLIK